MFESIDTHAVRTFEEAHDEKQKLIRMLVEAGISGYDAASVVYDAYDLGMNRAVRLMATSPK